MVSAFQSNNEESQNQTLKLFSFPRDILNSFKW